MPGYRRSGMLISRRPNRGAGVEERRVNRLGAVGTMVGTFCRHPPVFAQICSNFVPKAQSAKNAKSPASAGDQPYS
jgi:hypothetical protein